MCARSAKQKRVTVWTGMSHGRGAERTAAATLVFDKDGSQPWLDPVRPGTPDGVKPAAWGKRNDQSDRSLGIDRCGMRFGERQCLRCQYERPQPKNITPTHRAPFPRLITGAGFTGSGCGTPLMA